MLQSQWIKTIDLKKLLIEAPNLQDKILSSKFNVYILSILLQYNTFFFFSRPSTHIHCLYHMTKEGKEFLAHCDYVHKVSRDVIENRKKELVRNSERTS